MYLFKKIYFMVISDRGRDTEHTYIVLTLPIILKFLSEIIISPEDAPIFKIDEITT